MRSRKSNSEETLLTSSPLPTTPSTTARITPALVRLARVGRPPAGASAGEKGKDAPELSVRVPPDIKTRVCAVSHVRRTSQGHIITDAIECYFRDLPAAERAIVEDLIHRRSKHVKDR